MNLRVLRANPAGNITLYVLDPVPEEERGSVANRLMNSLPELAIEQVGYRCPPDPDVDGRMEMAGGEFCGNATRAYGYLIAGELGRRNSVRLRVSGMDRPVTVDVDLTAGTARSEMPLPLWVKEVSVDSVPGTLVHLGGIAHLVVENVTPSEEFFFRAEPILREIPDLDAYGVIFLDGENMRPLVKVPAAGSLVWEGSCGSGTLAAAVAGSQGAPDGLIARTFLQPAGTVEATVRREHGEITGAWIGGAVSLDTPITVEI